MAGILPNDVRDRVVAAFRQRVCDRLEIVPFRHQAEWWLASDGQVLAEPTEDDDGFAVQSHDGHRTRYRTVPRPGGPARVLADLGAYKVGKSFGAGIWGTGFAAVPNARVSLVGLEYDMCAPEFEYICDTLLSERGMSLPYESYQNRPRDGRMFLDLENGCRYEAKSWERKDSLKGKELDAYIFCLPLDAPVWMGDFSFKPLVDVVVGDEVISGKPKTDTSTRQKLQRATVTAIHRTRKEVLKITLASGRCVYGTPDHRWANGADGDTAARNRYFLPELGRKLAFVVDVPPALNDRELAGWLGGMYDGEGCRTLISQDAAHNAPLHRTLSQRLQQAGFQVTDTRDGVRWLGGRQAAVNFVNQIPSCRFRAKYADEAILTHRYKTADEIIAIESVGVRDVGCLTTTTGNFIAYGYQTSNCEAYQLPGIEIYTSNKQNLVARDGWAVFPTTPDRPWLQVLHECAHSGAEEFAGWHCTCGIPRSANRFTFSQQDQDQADPDKGGLMTREKFAIAYEGKLGQYVGRVFNYQRGDRIFTPESHPRLFRTATPTGPLDLTIPDGWTIDGACDTGAHLGGLLVAFDPEGAAYVLAEFPNYHYVNTEIEIDQQATIPSWANEIRSGMTYFHVRGLWADRNSQFKHELRNYGIQLFPASSALETRTEVVRTYLQRGELWLAPWLRILPYELENAQWPEEATQAGKFQRIKRNDHVLDCLEHLCARHPRGRAVQSTQTFGSWAASMGYTRKTTGGNVHTGRL